PADDQYLYTAEELHGQIAVLLAGAVAEEIAFGNRSTGSAGDFEQAAALAERIVHAGLSRLGIVHKDRLAPNVLHDEIQHILDGETARVRAWLKPRRAVMDELARRLLEEERVDGDVLRMQLAMADAAAAAAAAGAPGAAPPAPA
ncbi:MAG: hypothetical protein FWJ83_03005, partial [Limnochordales bacterium]